MNTHSDKTQENKSQSLANAVSQKQSGAESTFQFVDNRPEAVAQRKLQEMADNSQQVSQLRAFQDMANNSPQTEQAAQLQAMADNNREKRQPLQKASSKTGLPDALKSGMENLSGQSLDHVKVHYNSAKPAAIQAHAFAQGSNIHLAAGQEKHLPHELGHVVQQMEGRVKPTVNVDGVQVNDDPGLEIEATLMGDRALQMQSKLPFEVFQRRAKEAAEPYVTQSKSEQDYSGFQAMRGDFEGVSYKKMSTDDYTNWQGTVQAKEIHGVASHEGVTVITRYANAEVMQQAGFLENGKGYLVGAEGLLTIAAGIVICAATSGAGLIPGVAAIVTGILKVARGIMMVKWGSEATPGQKAILDAMRALEAVAAIAAAIATGNVGVWIFAVAKSIRSLLTAITNQMDDSHPKLKLWLQRIAAGCHFVEAIAIGAVGAGAIGGAETGGDVTKGLLGLGVGASKLTRAGDQAVAAAPSAATGWK